MTVQALAGSARRVLTGDRARLSTMDRAAGLEQASASARGRLDDAVLDRADEIVLRAKSRLRLSADHTVVAFAGATGSGKSSLFNRLVGLELAAVGVRRPTTSRTMACTWSPEGADELLSWLGIADRHHVPRLSALDSSGRPSDERLRGLVLLDLPDHDSSELSHRVEMSRLVEHADLLVWVLDPQKYADAAVHDRYLRPMASHAEVMFVVLNHVDRLPDAQRATTLADVRRLLDLDGLAEVPLLATSAVTGEGTTELTTALADRVQAKQALRQRLDADIRSAATAVRTEHGETAEAGQLDRRGRDALVQSLADAAGVPIVIRALERSVAARARSATGWPPTRWFGRLRANPFRDLRVAPVDQSSGVVRSSLPGATPVQRARVDSAVRELADRASDGLNKPWTQAVRRASNSRSDTLPDALDQAVVSTDLDENRRGWWWSPIGLLQWLLLTCALVGLAWLLVLAVLGWLQLPLPETPRTQGLPTPTLLLVAGILLGVVLANVSRVVARGSARRRARSAERLLHASVADVAESHVVAPVQAELDRHDRVGVGLGLALTP